MKQDINQKFASRKEGIDCPMCPDSSDEDVILELPSGKVHLQNDADYRGYCILIFRRHAVELHDLNDDERRQWIDDISHIGKAVTDLCHPAKLNISMLGNMVPHLHCHIMPRYLSDDDWGHPPHYRRPSERRPLAPEEYENLRLSLQKSLKTN
jgi:diadenosine tetraphosphate (Ap4A) HIT family hydrolase